MRTEAELAEMTQGEILPLFIIQALAFTACGPALWFMSHRPLDQFVTVDVQAIIWGLALAATMIALAASSLHIFPDFCDRMIRLQRPNFAFLKQPFSPL